MSEKLQSYIDLIRIKKPIGFMLLFWPCIWGHTISFDFNSNSIFFLYYSFLFLIGSILMRSAGCIVNDIVDKDFDKKVKRTKKRPIASGKVTVLEGLTLSFVLCLLALVVLIQFNKFTILLALVSMPLAFLYPFMKRFTYWPQFFLGITFNYGLILGWTSNQDNIGIIPIVFYVGAIFWTLGYDTIYGYQDIKDDEIIGVKSTSIKFKKNPKRFISICYSITFFSILLAGYFMEFKALFFIFLIIPFVHLLGYQIKNLQTKNDMKCLEIFKSNNLFGLIIFLNILIGKLSIS